jgi:hypothetical protein
MRISLFVASFGLALSALTGVAASAEAGPVTDAYPYCLLGRGGGSTTCYFRTREECGNGCINNPAYVGDARARAILARAGLAGSGNSSGLRSNAARSAPDLAGAIRRIDPRARASAGGSDGFDGWPTDYLMNRFGDHQAQGRF